MHSEMKYTKSIFSLPSLCLFFEHLDAHCLLRLQLHVLVELLLGLGVALQDGVGHGHAQAATFTPDLRI